MLPEKIPQTDFLDILFEGRNKDYGAYQLRKTYNRRLAKALAFTGSICLLLIGGYTLAGKFNGARAKALLINDSVTLVQVTRDKPVEPPAQIPKPHPLQMATIKDVIPRIVPDPQVRPEDVPPPNEDIDHAKIGTTTVKGDIDEGVPGPSSSTGNGTEVTAAPPSHEASRDSVYLIVQIESTYPGGMEAWKRFLLKNFHTPEQAISEGISGTVVVQFIVDKEGRVSDVQATSGPEELKAEAIRVIKKSGQWNVAIQNGHKVSSYKKQPIIFQLQDQ